MYKIVRYVVTRLEKHHDLACEMHTTLQCVPCMMQTGLSLHSGMAKRDQQDHHTWMILLEGTMYKLMVASARARHPFSLMFSDVNNLKHNIYKIYIYLLWDAYFMPYL